MHFGSITNVNFTDGNQFLNIAKVMSFWTICINISTSSFTTSLIYNTKCTYLRIWPGRLCTLEGHCSIFAISHISNTRCPNENHPGCSRRAAPSISETSGDKYLDNPSELTQAVKEYISSQGNNLTKNWNFPKAHLAKHMLWDIHEKSAVCNFTMCPNEKQHGPIRRAYLHQTNCKDVSKQVSSALLTQGLILCPFGAADHDFTPCQLAKLDQRTVVCKLICSCIKHLNEEHHKAVLDLSHLPHRQTVTMRSDIIQGTSNGVTYQGVNVEYSSSRCYSQRGYTRPQAAYQQRWDVADPGECLSCPEFLPSHCQ